ncbi:MAG: peptide chain release factor N(5)-glutamine methyltransferase [Phycisphaerales bacterium]|nr:peptide chain release factor N(5)-glutamine methyltransferase [Phycisphaerales bacterium]
MDQARDHARANAQATPPTPSAWTTRTLLAWMIDAFERKGVDEPRRSAELLLEHVLQCKRMHLYTHADRPASEPERDALRTLTARALQHEPVQYLLGEWSFFGLTIKLDKRVLIPRPCTEIIPTEVLQHARTRRADAPAEDPWSPLIADIGTGSGCITLAILSHLHEACAIATDLSPDALDVARANAERLQLADRITFAQGDLLEPVARELDHCGKLLDYLVSNPPYIPDHEWNDPAMMGRNVKGHEPELALRGGVDGMRLVRPLIERGPELLRPGGMLLIEIAASNADATLALAARHPLLEGECLLRDLDGLPRILVAQRSSAPALPN